MRQVPIALEQEQMPRKNTYTQAHRVKAHEDFQKIHDKGQSVVDGYGVFYFRLLLMTIPSWEQP